MKTAPRLLLRESLFPLLFGATFMVNGLQAQPWVTNGPSGKNILAITQSPTNSTLLYAGAFGWGVFKSSDGGATWANQKTGMTNTYVRSTLALSNNVVFAGTNDGVFKTIDGGVSWALSLATLNSVRSIAYDASTNSMYAATFGTGLYKSTDQGASWSPKNVTDPVSGETLLHQRVVTVFASNSLYVGGTISDIVLGGALFKSVDGGTSWIQVQRSIGIRSSVRSIALNPAAPTTGLIIGTAALGVYRSTNAGTSWSNIDTTGVANRLLDPQINVVGFTSAELYAGTDSLGKFYYRGVNDATVGWLVGSGLPGPPAVVNTMKVDGTTSSLVYAGTEGRGVYKSSNAGVSWVAQNAGMLGIAGRVVEINGNGNILLGTEFGDGIWISSNHASSWVKVDSLSTSNTITSFGTTTSPLVLYAGAYGSGVFKSTDGGVQWVLTDTSVVSHFVRTLSVHPTNQNQVYAGTGNGVYRTDNGGTTWFAVNTGIPTSTSIRSMAIDKTSPSTLYVGTDSSYMYKTVNGGSNWTHLTNANGFLPQDIFIRCITIDFNFPNTLYAGSDSGRVYKSTNAGSTWNLLSRMPSTFSVRAILMHPNNRKIFFGATFGAGIFVSADSGTHWTQFNSGLTDLEVYSLESDNASPLNLYAGTGSNGVFHTTYTFINAPPVLASVGNQSAVTGQQLLRTISASDPNATIPSLSVIGLPPGASFSDSGNGSARFAWTPTIAQIGAHLLTFIASDGSLSDSESVTITVLDSSQSTTVNFQGEAGWNLISVPLIVSDYRKTSLFSTAVSAAFGYHAGYSQRDTLQNGFGYWIKFSSSQFLTMGGTRLTRDTVNVDQQWNLIGSLTFPFTVANIKPVPPLAIVSPLYGFSSTGGFSVADTVRPGRGYWVKVSQAGKIVLDTTSSLMNEGSADTPFRKKSLHDSNPPGRLSVVDAHGRERTLYFSSDSNIEAARFDLPPTPPSGVFDARFDTQSSLAIAAEHDGRTEYAIRIVGAEFPLRFSWDVGSENAGWILELVGPSAHLQQFPLHGKGEAIASDGSQTDFKLSVQSGGLRELPAEFVLKQNYPNPFNPTTEIQYGLPSDGFVTLQVFNVLGQVVATLVDGRQTSSYRSALWNAAAEPSGVYYYELRVTDPVTGLPKFKEIKKMTLLK